ncbi:MAG: hypothetical protein II312_04500, partial [Lachnospiraceae bacterium]|nr:hypothetical protein [Lachnospiraceae bacterium]
MNNPWKDISLSDYERHMALDSVQQLQAMNQMMKGQLKQYYIQSAMILGVAGGIICFPAGLYVMWTNSRLPRMAKSVITLAVCAALVTVL